MDAIQVVRKTSGIPNGYYSTQNILQRFGINVNQFPQLFRVTKTDLVVKLPLHEQIFKQHVNAVQNNFSKILD